MIIGYDTKLIPIHPCAYRHRNYENEGKITNVLNVKPKENLDYRICFEVTFPDNFVDYVPVSEINDGNYKIVGDNDSL